MLLAMILAMVLAMVLAGKVEMVENLMVVLAVMVLVVLLVVLVVLVVLVLVVVVLVVVVVFIFHSWGWVHVDCVSVLTARLSLCRAPMVVIPSSFSSSMVSSVSVWPSISSARNREIVSESHN